MERFWIELFLRGLILCLLTALALGLLHRTTAAHRHLVCVLALVVLPMLPLLPRLMPTLRLLPPQRVTPPQRAMVPPQEASGIADIPRNSEGPVSPAKPQEPISGTNTSSLLPAGSGTAAQGMATLLPGSHREPASRVATALFALWGLGATTLLLRLLVALFRLHRLKAESRNAMLGSVPVRVSEKVQTPLTWGIRRSIILLPTALLSGNRAVCDSALRHEQAHIVRWDWMWNLLAELVCAFCWFQPGVWWLRSRMRLESERACDDRVLLSGVAGPDYAAHLLQILRSVGTNEVAPAMAQSRRGMEERMRHILDGAKPRHAPTKWLAVFAPFTLALLSLAALRVSARPAEAKRQPDRGATTMNSNNSSSRQAQKTDPAEKPGTTEPAGKPQGNARPALRFAEVVWGKAVNGLEPGFLLTTPGIARNRRVPFNSQVDYQVLVRNVTDQERFIGVHCGSANPWNHDPYFFPAADLRDALRSGKLPERFRAIGVTDLAVWPSGYDLKLAPGEAVVIPGDRGLYLGDADKQRFPRVEAVTAGKNWLVQPITIHLLNAEEKALAERIMNTPYSEKRDVMSVARDGKTLQKSVALMGARTGGKQLFARIQLEVGTRAAAAGRNSVGGQTLPGGGGVPSQPPASLPAMHPGDAAAPVAAALQEPADVTWGMGRDVQAGLRVRLWAAPQHAARFIFDVYIRNRTSHTLTVTCPSFAGLTVPSDAEYGTVLQSASIYCSPHLQNSKGRPVNVTFQQGADESQYVIGPGQVVYVSHWMLRTMDRRAKEARRANDTLVALVEPGKHRVYCDVSASWGSQEGQRTPLRTGKVDFDVTGADVAAE